jgi:Carbohydrate binding domain
MRIAHLFSLGFVAVSAMAACSGSSPPCQGAVRCNCYPNSTCNRGLICLSNLCVVPPDGSIIIVQGGSDASQVSTDDAGSDDATASTDDAPTSTGSDAPVSSGTNLVTNGDFSQGTTGWGIVYGAATIAAMNSELCVTVQANQQAILGWPEPTGTAGVSLSTAPYTLSYMARVQASQGTPAPVSVDAKIGQTIAPYNADFETPGNAGDNVTASSQTFTHTFTPPAADTSAGLAFSFQATQAEDVCFKDVRLVQN